VTQKFEKGEGVSSRAHVFLKTLHTFFSIEPYWRGWFQGLSKAFLTSWHPKMLLLAGVDRLDKDLIIGQMQGRRV
jgi:hypothetical protein